MCHFLLEKTFGGIATGEHKSLVSSYDATDLFMHSVLTYFNDNSGSDWSVSSADATGKHAGKCRRALECLMTFICQLHGQRDGQESKVHHLVMEWMGTEGSTINVGIGAKVMTLMIKV